MFTTSSGDTHSSRSSEPFLLGSPEKSSGANGSESLSSAPFAIAKPEALQKNWALLRKLHRAKLIAQQKGHLPLPSESTVTPDELKALQKAAQQGELQKSQTGLRSGKTLLSFAGYEQFGGHAAPISPLRERDLKVLADLFQRSDMHEIEANINQCLLQLLPEPCWEDNPFDWVYEFA